MQKPWDGLLKKKEKSGKGFALLVAQIFIFSFHKEKLKAYELYQLLLLCPHKASFSLFYLNILLNYSAYILHIPFFPSLKYFHVVVLAGERKS